MQMIELKENEKFNFISINYDYEITNYLSGTGFSNIDFVQK